MVPIAEAAAKVKRELAQNQRREEDEERCPICFCDLFECDLFADQISAHADQEDVVLMSKCTDHYYHRECLEN